MRDVWIVPFVFLLIGGSALAQRAVHPAHVVPKVPLEILQRPVPIRSGIGTAHDEVGTASAEARAFYHQGLAYLHHFVWIEAARSFNQAIRHDAQLGLAHAALSVAYTELNHPDAAQAALARARELAPAASDHDRRHIELRVLQAAAEAAPGDKTRLAAYRSAVDDALKAYPQDAELWLLRGRAESADPAERGQGSPPSAVPFYERALALAPTHVAAPHYLAHAHENAGQQAAALARSEALAAAAPRVPHARHMLAHNLRRGGRPLDAIKEFEAADALHREYIASEKIAAEHDWHYHHNLDLLAASYQYVGQMKKAEALYERAFALPSNLIGQLFNKRAWPMFLRSRGRYQEAGEAAQVLVNHPHPLIKATGHIELSFTFLAASRIADAAEHFNAALKILRSGPEGALLAAPAMLALQGELSLRSAQRAKGREVMEEVARRLRAVPGPDHWVHALFAIESMARAARAVGDWELAGRLAAELLAHDSAYAGAHYASALVDERLENTAAAQASFETARKLWAGADPDLPELAEIRKRLR